MIFNEHSDLNGLHAFLGSSKHSWLNWDEETTIARYRSQWASTIGTHLHEIAATLIRNRMKLTKNDKKLVRFKLMEKGVPSYAYNIDDYYDNLMNYVNDAIGYRMTPEVVLKYSDVCFGTADTIDFKENERLLRIHDYKSGTSPVSMDQLMIYAGLFYLEYHKRLNFRLEELEIELRIYQGGDIVYFNPTVEDMAHIVDQIVFKSKLLADFRERGV